MSLWWTILMYTEIIDVLRWMWYSGLGSSKRSGQKDVIRALLNSRTSHTNVLFFLAVHKLPFFYYVGQPRTSPVTSTSVFYHWGATIHSITVGDSNLKMMSRIWGRVFDSSPVYSSAQPSQSENNILCCWGKTGAVNHLYVPRPSFLYTPTTHNGLKGLKLKKKKN